MRLVLPAALISTILVAAAPAMADNDRSAAVPQVAKSASMAERSSAALDQISSVESGRTRLDQIDPGATDAASVDDDRLGAAEASGSPDACSLTNEQQAIVTSLAAQGKLPAGDCEMAAWFAAPRDKDELEGRQSLAEAVVAGAPELLGRNAEADRLAEIEAEQQRADAAAAALALSLLAPPPPPPPGK